MEDGIDPFRWLLLRYNKRRLVRLPIEEGILPTSIFSDKALHEQVKKEESSQEYNSCKYFSFPMDEGMVPLN